LLTLRSGFQLLSIGAFLYYGSLCLFSRELVLEFERYRLSRFRILTGLLEISGALGLWVGFYFPILKLIASAGLTLLMMCGIWARLRIRDPWFSFIPAFLLGLINFVIFYFEFKG
jgi:hypothetical protein